MSLILAWAGSVARQASLPARPVFPGHLLPAVAPDSTRRGRVPGGTRGPEWMVPCSDPHPTPLATSYPKPVPRSEVTPSSLFAAPCSQGETVPSPRTGGRGLSSLLWRRRDLGGSVSGPDGWSGSAPHVLHAGWLVAAGENLTTPEDDSRCSPQPSCLRDLRLPRLPALPLPPSLTLASSLPLPQGRNRPASGASDCDQHLQRLPRGSPGLSLYPQRHRLLSELKSPL